jgi:hypothetical protein
MSVFIFKNLCIYERGEKDVDNAKVRLLSLYDCWFPNSIFNVKNTDDKIVLFFENSFFKHDKLIEIDLNYNIDVVKSIGCIKFYFSPTGIKVFHVNLNLIRLEENLKVFREYLVELVKKFKYKNKCSLDNYSFSLQWDCKMDTQIKNLLIKNNLLNSQHLFHKFYFFSEKDLLFTQ